MKRLRYFVTVAQTGSFSAAGKHFYISASAVNQQITQLEFELGLKLFDRSGYKPALTVPGQHLFQEAQKLIQNYDVMISQTQLLEKARTSRSHLTLGLAGPFENRHLPDIIQAFNAMHGTHTFKFQQKNFGDLHTLLCDGHVDAAFGIENDFSDDTLVFNRLFPLKMMVICSPQHRWAKQKTVTGRELQEEPLVLLSQAVGKRYYQTMMESFESDNVHPRISSEYDSLESLLTAVRIQEGVAVLCEEVISPYEELISIPLTKTHHHATYGLAYPKNAPAKVLDFAQVVSEVLVQKM